MSIGAGSHLTADTGIAADRVLVTADELSRHSERLDSEFDVFLRDVKAP